MIEDTHINIIKYVCKKAEEAYPVLAKAGLDSDHAGKYTYSLWYNPIITTIDGIGYQIFINFTLHEDLSKFTVRLELKSYGTSRVKQTSIDLSNPDMIDVMIDYLDRFISELATPLDPKDEF